MDTTISIGKISIRPMNISNVNMNLTISGSVEKLPIVPNSPIPGPTFPKDDNVPEKAAPTSVQQIMTIINEIIRTKRYATMKRNTEVTASFLTIMPSILVLATEEGCRRL